MAMKKDYYIPLYIDDTVAGFDVTGEMADYDNLVVIDTEQPTNASAIFINVRDEFIRAVIEKMGNERLHVFDIYVNLFKTNKFKTVTCQPRVGDEFPAMTRQGNFYYGVNDFGRPGCSFYVDNYAEYAKAARHTIHIELRTYRRSDGKYDTVAYTYPYYDLKLATHHSLTFSEPLHVLGDMIDGRYAKCQSLNLQQQYALGVRMFDFRFRQDGDSGRPLVAHGRIEYTADVESSLDYLNTLPNVTVRLMLENFGLIERKRKKDYGWFSSYVSGLKNRYKNIYFCGGLSKKGGDKVATDVPNEPQIIQLIDQGGLTTPRVYAERNNWNNRSRINYRTWTMFDYVELCFHQS